MQKDFKTRQIHGIRKVMRKKEAPPDSRTYFETGSRQGSVFKAVEKNNPEVM